MTKTTDSSSGTPHFTAPPAGIQDRAIGALTGAAIGDAVGGATEGFSPDQIQERWGGPVLGVVESYHGQSWRTARPISPYHKGDGHFTDDTIMTLLLSEVYVEQRRHLGAYDMADHLIPKMMGAARYIPELEGESLPVHRLFLAEKYPVLRLAFANVDPREAGVGNMVNCGAAMYMSPVGIVNAGDPDAAYAEAIDLAGAHQSSYGREAAGVLAAAVAAAASPRAGVPDVLDAALRLAKDGTRSAIEATLEASTRVAHWTDAVASGVLRDAIRPFDTVGEVYRQPGLGARRPSRVHAIEELPIALAFVAIADGRYLDAMLGGVNYGRDSDSIASMAGAISGALGGAAAVDATLIAEVSAASRTDLIEPAIALAAATAVIRASDDLARAETRARTAGLFDR